MSAGVLRRAASLIRERAEAARLASPGDWSSDRFFWKQGPGGEDSWWYGIGAARPGFYTAVSKDRRESDHIASWHPAVALAVADWLDRAADFYDPPATGSGPKARRITDTEWTGRPLDRDLALAVARAYLGESE